jgi:hypothetical protein
MSSTSDVHIASMKIIRIVILTVDQRAATP